MLTRNSTIDQESTFNFILDPIGGNSVGLIPESNVQSLCRRFFDKVSLASAQPFPSIDFAEFIRTIGPANAAMITSLSFRGPSTSSVMECMPIICELTLLHLPGLRSLTIHMFDSSIFTGEPHRCRRDVSYRPAPAFWPLYTALERFLHRAVWVRKFEYSGKEHWCEFGEEDEGWRVLKAFEGLVERRHIADRSS